MNLTYYQLVEGMSADQRDDLDFTLVQEPGRQHLRRPRGANALLGLLGAGGAPRGKGRPTGNGKAKGGRGR